VRRPSPPVQIHDLEQLLRLYVAGWSEEELADLIGVHPARVPVILERAMKELRARQRELAASETVLVLEGLDSVIEANVRIVVTRCPACGGDEQARITCRKCRWTDTAYGPTGYAYAPTRRTTALRRIRHAAWQRVKLLGLDKPPPTSVTGTPRHPKPSGPIADYLEQSLRKELPGVELEDGMSDVVAEFALEREVLLSEALMREAVEIGYRKCLACGGDEVQRVKCAACNRTGYFYGPDTRHAASSRIAAERDHRIELLGLDRQPPLRPATGGETSSAEVSANARPTTRRGRKPVGHKNVFSVVHTARGHTLASGGGKTCAESSLRASWS
jgi:predicted RNA-binding Zn-ribbon protein involved in translation (DUF1610 family)